LFQKIRLRGPQKQNTSVIQKTAKVPPYAIIRWKLAWETPKLELLLGYEETYHLQKIITIAIASVHG